MLVDMDYFFAQCEELRNAAIRSKPVVVCVFSGRSEDSGAVSTANYVARSYGVKSGMPIYLAKKKLEDFDAAFLPVDEKYYEEISGKVMNILRKYADRFEQAGIDEAYLDVTQRTSGRFQEAKQLAVSMKDEVKAQLKLTCSIGIGPNKLVAKIAADEKKPDGLTVIAPERVEEFLSPLKVRRLLGVGTKTREKMQSLGISTVHELAKYDPQRLNDIFGRTMGIYFHNAALGIDAEPVEERSEVESFSRITTLKQDSRDLSFIMETAERLCSEIHGTVVSERMNFKTVGIIAILKDLSTHTRSKTLENPTNSLEVLNKSAKELFEKFFNETEGEARRVGVKVSNLSRERTSQKQLTSFFQKSSG
jgi:DNA polymerase IV (DinB-like DNA polymerase)